MRTDRRVKRSRMRKAYEILSKRWREQRQKQHAYSALGLETEPVARKPPISIFAMCIPEGEDPVQIAQETNSIELFEYAREFEFPRWQGDVPGYRSPANNPYRGVGRNDACPCDSGKKFKRCCLEEARSMTGVQTIPMLGDEPDDDGDRGVTTIDIAGGDED